jgi:hypothetical protein
LFLGDEAIWLLSRSSIYGDKTIGKLNLFVVLNVYTFNSRIAVRQAHCPELVEGLRRQTTITPPRNDV